MNHSFYEFFAGGGMARLGLGPAWNCLLANDIDPKKMETYRANFGDDGTLLGDIASLKSNSMPGSPTLAWASFPCQDLSLAGNRMGLAGERSGTFWGFWSAINKLTATGRSPSILVLENVCGLMTSHGGRDFQDMCRAIASLGYSFGAIVCDAIHFVPQSRPRLFVICVRDKGSIPATTRANCASDVWHSQTLKTAVQALPPDLKANWIWWNLPQSIGSKPLLTKLLESDDQVAWNSQAQTNALLHMMSKTNHEKVLLEQKRGGRSVGTVYKRTRIEDGTRTQRAEVRFDGVAGCLRTPGGGSSRQTIIVVEGKRVTSRLLSIREAARLMGVKDEYKVPQNYNDGYHIFGDGLAVPVVDHIARNLLDPIADCLSSKQLVRKKLAA